MAKKTKPKEENGVSAAQVKNPAQQPLLSVLAQYIKDFSFENPNSPASLRPRDASPEINININVSANGLSQSDFEVTLQLEARAVDKKAEGGKGVVFNAELVYAGVFRIQGLPPETLQQALLIECPRILFPFARQIIADATRNGGFPPLMIDPIDFMRLYQSRLADQAKASAAN